VVTTHTQLYFTTDVVAKKTYILNTVNYIKQKNLTKEKKQYYCAQSEQE